MLYVEILETYRKVIGVDTDDPETALNTVHEKYRKDEIVIEKFHCIGADFMVMDENGDEIIIRR